MEPENVLTTLPLEILFLIFSYLSANDILHLPNSVIARGLKDGEPRARYSNFTSGLDRKSLYELYRLCSIPYLASALREITILTDRVFMPTVHLFFQHQLARHAGLISLRDGCHCRTVCYKCLSVEDMHDWMVPTGNGLHFCPLCRGIPLYKQQAALAHAADSRRRVESSGLDLSILVCVFRRCVHLEIINIESTLSRLQREQRADWIKATQGHHRTMKMALGAIPECQDWDMKLDTRRANVLVLKALLAAKSKVKRLNTFRCVARAHMWDDSGYCIPLSEVLVREKRSLRHAMVDAAGRERNTEHALGVWSRCLMDWVLREST